MILILISRIVLQYYSMNQLCCLHIFNMWKMTAWSMECNMINYIMITNLGN